MKMSIIRNVKTPTRATSGSAGYDFYTPRDMNTIILEPNEQLLIPSGVMVELNNNTALIANNKSSIATKGLLVGASVVDSDYQGEIHINLWNVSKHAITVFANQKIVQFILTPIIYEEPEVVPQTLLHKSYSERGAGGFGSTNKND